MKRTVKFMIIALATFFVLFGTAFATPKITGVSVDNSGGQNIVLVSFANANVSSGIYTQLSFTINELGTTKDMGFVKVDSATKTLQFPLSDITDSYTQLKKGSTYTVTANASNTAASTSFLFGTYQGTSGLGLNLNQITLNGAQVKAADTLQVMNGETLNLSLQFSALQNFDNARFMAYIEGYEHSPIIVSSKIFSVVAGNTYTKTLQIKLPSDMVSGKDYTLRITGANDLSGNTYKAFNIYVDTQRNRVDVLDLVTTPSSAVEAGQNMVADVRMENRGQRTESSVKVTVAIPKLGISQSSYVSNLAPTQTITSDDMLLSIPQNATPQTYQAKVTLAYNGGYTTTNKTYNITVVAPKVATEKNLLVNFQNNVNLVAGQTTSIPVVIANPNSDSKPISIDVAPNTWANVEVTPSLAMVQGGSSQTFTVKVTPKSAISGDQQLSMNIKDGSNVLSTLALKAYVQPTNQISWTNVVLIVLLIIAIIILLTIVIKISKKRNDEDEDVTSSKEYY